MKSTRGMIQDLVNAGVLSYDAGQYLYKGIPFCIDSWSSFVTISNSLFEHPDFPTEELRPLDRYAIHKLIDWLWVTKVETPKLFFKNGKIREGFIKETLVRLEAGSGIARYPGTRVYINRISKNWENIPQEKRTDLQRHFTSDGKCKALWVLAHVINENGLVTTEHLDPNDYDSSVCLIEGVESKYFIQKGLPKDYSIKVNGTTYQVSKPEYNFIIAHLKKCNSCESWHNSSGTVFGLCPDCSGEFPRDLRRYSERAHEIFSPLVGKSKYSSILMGVELEYERTNKGTQQETLFLLYRHLKDHAIFKRDSSLANGIEICTRPSSIDIHLDSFKPMFEDEKLWERMEVKSTCGMHVHIDRRKMTALTLGKLIKFIQDKQNKAFLEQIAERGSNRYSSLGTDLSVTSHHRGAAAASRYQGINVQNPNTAELRMFSTPPTYTQFLKNMEFVSAISDFVQPANSGIKDLCVDGFMKFVKNNQSIYKELHKFTKGM